MTSIELKRKRKIDFKGLLMLAIALGYEDCIISAQADAIAAEAEYMKALGYGLK